jgi:hypothetical protein
LQGQAVLLLDGLIFLRVPVCAFPAGFHCGNMVRVADMERSLIWVGGEDKGWTCSNCHWRFPVPTLLSGEEAKAAYDRLAAGKFRDHNCESGASFFGAEHETKHDTSASFADRARKLVKGGYKPKVAVEIVLHEMEFEQGGNSNMMAKARADAEDFLMRVRKGLI